MKLVIFGAQGYAFGAYKALTTLYPKRVIPCFIVTKMGYNSPMLGNIPVREIEDVSGEMSQQEKDSVEVIIATPEFVQPEIEETLENYGFRHYSRLDSDRWNELMKMFHIKLGLFLPLSALPVGYNKAFMRTYLVRCHKDEVLRNPPVLPDYVLPMQAGAKLTSVKMAAILDSTGENISGKNPNYSELSGLYWVWKNKLCQVGTDEADDLQYYGLAQYRRMLIFSEDDRLRLLDNDVDVVLPYPMPYEPNVHAHHRRYLKDPDWNALLEALRELEPEYADFFPTVLEQQYHYNYNVILARKPVIRDYCKWLFSILERVEDLSVPKASERGDRYLGYMGETLETLYFMKNADRLNIVHTECKLYV